MTGWANSGRWIIVSALAAGITGTAMATEHNQAISLSFQCNENGAVFADLQGQTVYLGKSCDAYVPGHGTGHWWYAASGFVLSAGAYSVKFNSDVICKIPYCRPPK